MTGWCCNGIGVMDVWVWLLVWWCGFSLCFVCFYGCKYSPCLVIGCCCMFIAYLCGLGYGMWWLGRWLWDVWCE